MIYKKKFEIREHLGAVFSLSKDKDFIYSASADKFVTRWSPVDGKQDLFAIKCESSVYKIIHFNFRDILVIGTSIGDLHLIDTEKKNEIKFIKHHKSAIFDICIDEKNEKMYVGDADGNLSVWDVRDWSLLLNLPFDCGKIRTIQILEDIHLLLFGSQDGMIRVMDINTYNLITTFEAHNGGCLSLCKSLSKKSILFSSGKDGCIRAWKISKWEQVFSIPAHKESIYKLKENNGALFSVSRDKSVKIWDVDTLDFITKIERRSGGHTHSVNDLMFFDSFLLTAGDDKRINCWEIEFN